MAPSPTLTPLPPEQAVRFLGLKGRRAGFDWRDMWQEEHAISFTVAKMMQADLLTDVHGSLVAALKDGQSYEQWAAGITPLLQAKGWWGRAVMTDPADGVDKLVQLGSPRRLRIIYDTNVRMAMAAGQWERIEAVKAHRPYLRYVAVKDARTRPEHLRWHGTILPVDDPWWDTHSPPCGWRCRCTLQQLSASDLTREGWTVSEGPPPDSAPPQTYVNARTGDTSTVPEGVDPGFAYHKGRAARAAETARRLMDRLSDLPAPVGAALAEPGRLASALADDFAQWYDGLDLTRPAGGQRAVTALTPRTIAYLTAEAGVEPASAVVAATEKRLGHARSPDHRADRIDVPDAVMRRLPEYMAAPRAILWDRLTKSLIYVLNVPAALLADKKPGRTTAKVVVHVNVTAKGRDESGQRATRVLNVLHTAFLADPQAFADEKTFALIEGER